MPAESHSLQCSDFKDEGTRVVVEASELGRAAAALDCRGWEERITAGGEAAREQKESENYPSQARWSGTELCLAAIVDLEDAPGLWDWGELANSGSILEKEIRWQAEDPRHSQ